MAIDPREHLAAFLRDIKDNPDDDTPRLVLADWLQDQGDPRGEYLALAVARGRTPIDDPRHAELYHRERLFLRDHVWMWLGPLADVCSRWTFPRGLIHVEARPEKLLTEGVEDYARAGTFDWVEGVRLTEAVTEQVTRLARSPILDQIASLDLSHLRLNDRALRRLLDSPKLTGLRVLKLATNHFTPRVVDLLARCPYLNGLRRLDLSDNWLDLYDGVRRLATSPHLCQLRSLDVRGNFVTSTAVVALRERFGEVLHGHPVAVFARPDLQTP